MIESMCEHVNMLVKEPVNEHVSEPAKGNGKDKLVILDDKVNCNELNNDFESDEEGERNKSFPIFNVALKMKIPMLKLGMIFSDHKVLKQAIKS